jgi:hypothetical protein
MQVSRLSLSIPQTRKTVSSHYRISVKTLDRYLKKYRTVKNERIIPPAILKQFVREFEGIDTNGLNYVEAYY